MVQILFYQPLLQLVAGAVELTALPQQVKVIQAVPAAVVATVIVVVLEQQTKVLPVEIQLTALLVAVVAGHPQRR
jgi:hypothetical protein